MTRWGILAPGYIAGVFAEDLAKAGSKVTAVASRDLSRAEAFAAKHVIPRAHGSYQALAEDAEVDVVYIASPHSHHHEHAKLMLKAGKHLLLEKPFTMNRGQAQELIDLARAKGLLLMDALWTLCNPLYRQLQARVAAGEIGTPRAFAAQIGPMGTGENTRILDPAQGGSFTLECMTYPMNILAGLAPGLTKEAKVTASGLLTAQGVDSASSIALETAEGYASMAGGFVPGVEGMGGSGFQLIGDKGWLAVTDNLFNPGRALLSTAKGVEELTCPDARYGHEIAEVEACLAQGALESDRVPHDLTLTVMGLLDQALMQIRGRVLS